MPRENVQEWIDNKIPNTFCDPFTGIKPTSERELTAVLSVFHQMNKVNWQRVKMRSVLDESDVIPSSQKILSSDLVMSEYPLFARGDYEIGWWGGMTPDLAFTDREVSRLVIVEAKIDSHFTFSDEPPDGQVSRYLKYLKKCPVKEKCLVVLCPKFNTDWYAERMKRAVVKLGSIVPTYTMEWDDIFKYGLILGI